MEAQRAQALLTDAYAQLGAIAEPIMTTLKTMAADVLTAMIPFVSLMGEGLQGVLNGTAVAAETFAEGISGLVSVLMEKLSTIVPVIGEAILASLPAVSYTHLVQLTIDFLHGTGIPASHVCYLNPVTGVVDTKHQHC